VVRDLFWIDGSWPGQLAIAPRPRGDGWLEGEIKAWRRAGIGAVVSLLTPEEETEFGLQQEADYCSASGMDYYSLPIQDRGVPSSDADVSGLVMKLKSELAGGKNVAVHCRQGIGRSALIAAGLLVESGLSPAEAIQRVTDARQIPVPETPEQREWIESFRATLEQNR
jgi:protein-tyrosine phosphatase